MAKDTALLPDINDQLFRHLQDKREILIISREFDGLKNNDGRVALAYDLLRENDLLPELITDCKSNTTSQIFRQQGNEMFKKKKSREAHEFYTKSIATAEDVDDNLSLGYANRSAVLFEEGLYEECLTDINLALEAGYPERLRSKLMTRRSKAEELLPTQEKVDFFTELPTIPESERNPLIQSAAKSIRLENTESLGRHVVATRDLDPGEIIAIENPFCQVLTDEFYTHCHHCLKLCYTLTPCPDCTQALYCNESCRVEANESYHKYECPILLTIKSMDLLCKLIHLRVAILAKDDYKKLDPGEDATYRSDRYYEIHNLVANTSNRSVADLFNRAVRAAAFCHLLKTYTEFFTERDTDFGGLLLHHMQTGPCNFHEISEMKSSDKSSDQQEIGSGAYSFLSMFNHSCSPNVVRYSYGSTMIVITIDVIKKGQQCLENYGPHYALMTKRDRQTKLKKQYLFDCNCLACVDDYPLYESMKQTERVEDFITQKDLQMLQEYDLVDDYPLYESMKRTERVEDFITQKELQMLQDYNLGEAKRIFKKLVANIKRIGAGRFSMELAEHQEALKQCLFIFSTIRTPM